MDTKHGNALVDAAASGALEKFELLLEAENPTEEIIQSLLTAATWNSHFHIVAHLLSRFPSVPLHEETVRAAIWSGSADLVSRLLSKDPAIVNLEFDAGGTPLSIACSNQQPVEFLELLLKAGADPNQPPPKDLYPLANVAAFYHQTSVIDLLVEYGARLDHCGALVGATSLGNEIMLKHLLEQGLDQDTDLVDLRRHEAALNIAVRDGNIAIVKLLLENGARGGKIYADGQTALEVAKDTEYKKGKDLSEIKDLLTRYY